MTRWTVRSVALLMYTLRLYDDVIKRRRRGLSAVHSGAHFLKKNRNFLFSSSVFDRVFLFVTFLLFHFPQKIRFVHLLLHSCRFLLINSILSSSIQNADGLRDLQEQPTWNKSILFLTSFVGSIKDSITLFAVIVVVVVLVVASSISYRIDIIFLRWRFGKRLADHRTATPPLFTHSPSFFHYYFCSFLSNMIFPHILGFLNLLRIRGFCTSSASTYMTE